MRIGSDAHKKLFCRWFIDTHRRYAPEDLPWPELDDASVERLRSVPIWSDVLAAERRAAALVKAFASTQSDPLLREAIALQGAEEDRHGRILARMFARYGLRIEEQRLQFDATERCFVEFGYKECLDAFMGYGAFRLARDANFMPGRFISMFDGFMHEETRHIVFFVNWIAYERARRKEPALRQAYETATGYLGAFRILTNTVKAASSDSGFMGGGEAFSEIDAATLIRTCLRENDLQMAKFDSGLLRPRVIPALARIALGLLYAADRVHELGHRQG